MAKVYRVRWKTDNQGKEIFFSKKDDAQTLITSLTAACRLLQMDVTACAICMDELALT